MLESLYDQKDGAYYAYDRPEMQPFVPSTVKRLLEVGCGRAGFGCRFQDAGVEVWGIELMPEAAAAAQQVLTKVLVGDFFSVVESLPAGYFDAVVFNDVLEHMLEPEAALRRTATLLAPGAVIVASIPNFLYWPNIRALLVQRDWVYRDAGILDRTHVRFFTLKSMLRLFGSAGYAIERTAGINPYVGPPRFQWIRRLLGRRIDDFAYAQFALVAHLHPA